MEKKYLCYGCILSMLTEKSLICHQEWYLGIHGEALQKVTIPIKEVDNIVSFKNYD